MPVSGYGVLFDAPTWGNPDIQYSFDEKDLFLLLRKIHLR